MDLLLTEEFLLYPPEHKAGDAGYGGKIIVRDLDQDGDKQLSA